MILGKTAKIFTGKSRSLFIIIAAMMNRVNNKMRSKKKKEKERDYKKKVERLLSFHLKKITDNNQATKMNRLF